MTQHPEQCSQVHYGQQFRRGRFFNFPVQNLHLSSRFGTVPLPMERDVEAGGYQQNPPHSDRYGLNPYPQLPPIGRRQTPDYSVAGGAGTSAALSGLFNRLPPYTGRLMSSPLQLSGEEEFALMQELQNQLRYLDFSKLKQVYSDLANFDDELTGLCLFEELNEALVRNNIFLSNPLARLVASVFLSPYEMPRINYEKVLSFIGASLRVLDKEPSSAQYNGSYYQQPQQQHQQPLNGHAEQYPAHGGVYYSPEDQQHQQQQPYEHRLPQSPPSPPRSPPSGTLGTLSDRNLPRVLRQLEAEVASVISERPINFESLRIAFQRADRLHRGSLSGEQLKHLVWDFRLPLSEQVLDSAIALCRHRGGGQYDWEQFLNLLERVIAPQSTGLRIPVAKRPLEYARQFPQPAASWPHAEPQGPQPLYRTPSPQPPTNRQRSQQPPPSNHAGVILTEPWFNRFMKLADALYRRDSEARGFVSESQVKALIDQYNRDYELAMSQIAVQSALEASRVGSDGRVNINDLLRRLAVRPGAA